MPEPPRLPALRVSGSETGGRCAKWSSRLRLSHAVQIISCLLATLGVAAVYYVGSMPVRGLVRVDVHQSDRLEKILKENGMFLWTGIGHLGAMEVAFDNPIALCTIDDQVLEDARTNKYWCRIRYECVIPYFNYERGEN